MAEEATASKNTKVKTSFFANLLQGFHEAVIGKDADYIKTIEVVERHKGALSKGVDAFVQTAGREKDKSMGGDGSCTGIDVSGIVGGGSGAGMEM